jgi:hypothetical protein
MEDILRSNEALRAYVVVDLLDIILVELKA